MHSKVHETVLLRRHFKLCCVLSNDIAVRRLAVFGDQPLAERAVTLSIFYSEDYDGISTCTKLPGLSNCIYPRGMF